MRPKIVLFGDSITEDSFGDGGWGASLADLLRRKVYIFLFINTQFCMNYSIMKKTTYIL